MALLEHGHEYAFTMEDFHFLSALAKELTGIEFSDSKFHMMYSRLTKILRDRQLPDFNAYCLFLKNNRDPLVIGEFIDSITTNLTSFFREKHHFVELAERILPALAKKHPNHYCLKVWIAGCSTGEEAYTASFVIQDYIVDHHLSWTSEIIASDIDSKVLETAQNGIYDLSRIEHDIPAHCIGKWFQKGQGAQTNRCRVKALYRDNIHFKLINLIKSVDPLKGWYGDIIFCRNVLIYFDVPTQIKVLDLFMSHLNKDGYFFAGHSESTVGRYPKLGLITKTLYRKL